MTLGGVDTRPCRSRPWSARPAGLYFIGEVVDITGWLGGYNFQWAACLRAGAARAQCLASAAFAAWQIPPEKAL